MKNTVINQINNSDIHLIFQQYLVGRDKHVEFQFLVARMTPLFSTNLNTNRNNTKTEWKAPVKKHPYFLQQNIYR